MEIKRRFARALAVFSVAIAAGHVVQSLSASPDGGMAGEGAVVQPKAVTNVVAGPEATLDLQPATPTAPTDAQDLAAAPPADAMPLPVTPGVSEAKAPVLASVLPGLPLPSQPPAAADPEPAVQVVSAGPEAGTKTITTEKDGVSIARVVDGGPIVPNVFDPQALAMDTCTEDMTLTAQPHAMLDVVLAATCRAGERVVLRHADLAISGLISDAGALSVLVPALSETGEVRLRFEDGTEIVKAVPIPEAATLRRVAVQWMDLDTLALHAFEDGAGYDMPGHVSAANPGRMPVVASDGGYLTLLGDPASKPAMLAEVYTYPSDRLKPVELSVEAAVTDQTCARGLIGEVIAVDGLRASVSDVEIAMPDCSAVGDSLVLKDLSSDRILAAAN